MIERIQILHRPPRSPGECAAQLRFVGRYIVALCIFWWLAMTTDYAYLISILPGRLPDPIATVARDSLAFALAWPLWGALVGLLIVRNRDWLSVPFYRWSSRRGAGHLKP